jgi:hypothetical protein
LNANMLKHVGDDDEGPGVKMLPKNGDRREELSSNERSISDTDTGYLSKENDHSTEISEYADVDYCHGNFAGGTTDPSRNALPPPPHVVATDNANEEDQPGSANNEFTGHPMNETPTSASDAQPPPLMVHRLPFKTHSPV